MSDESSFDESSFERLSSSSSLNDQFSELEVGRERAYYFRTYVKYRRPFTLVDTQMFTPNVYPRVGCDIVVGVKQR